MPFNTESNVNNAPSRVCSHCGGYVFEACETTVSISRDSRRCRIERIPALRCLACDEILIEPETADKLRALGGAVQDSLLTLRRVEEPVISFPMLCRRAARRPDSNRPV